MPTTRAGSKRLLRDLNRSIVLNQIAARARISRTSLARESGLPAATITRIVGDFVRAGLVVETPSEESSGGRKPVLLSLNPAAGYVVGVKLREDGMTVALCDLDCAPLYHAEAPLIPSLEPYKAVEAIAEAIEQCITDAGVPRSAVFGVGVGMPGLVDSVHGICRLSAILHWQAVEIGPALEYKLRLPVRVDNDVNTLAVAERHFGAGREVGDFILVTVGRGIGLGVVVGGEIYRGSHGGAGEFGHITVDTSEEAALCNCGKRGCLEAVASDYGILRAATGADPGSQVEQSMSALLLRARDGDEGVRAIFTRAGMALGVALANLINIFDPALLVIGGEGLRAGALLVEPMRRTLPLHVFGKERDVTSIVLRQTTEVEWARGAASLMLREVFRAPIYESDSELLIDTLLSPRPHSARKRG
jgi:N-acetylglucosamine repressor